MRELQHQIASPRELVAWVREARQMTTTLTQDLTPKQLLGVRKETVNPILWAMGHISWFQEKWVLRHLSDRPSLNPAVDRWFDSFEVAHETRWNLDMPPAKQIMRYMADVLEQVELRIVEMGKNKASTYFNRLSVFHEDMHCEAMVIDRQTLRFPAPTPVRETAAPQPEGGAWPGDVKIPGARNFPLGATPDMPYVFDNEKWAHPVRVEPFAIAKAPVTNGQFAEFVESGGYNKPKWWSVAGKLWLSKSKSQHPIYWRKAPGGGWQHRRFNRWQNQAEHHPATNISWYEAEAFCAWAGRRLPTEAEWELAASADHGAGKAGKRRYPWGEENPTAELANMDLHYGGPVAVGALAAGDSAYGCRQMLGNVWEWTADGFYPYPGFVMDPYKEYSAPWFGYQKVLRGGAWSTRSRMVRNTWRNFYLPHRSDVFVGFRTCAL